MKYVFKAKAFNDLYFLEAKPCNFEIVDQVGKNKDS